LLTRFTRESIKRGTDRERAADRDEVLVMRSLTVLFTATAAAVAIGVFPAAGWAQRPVTPPVATSALAGREIFQFYCAPCHGAAGKGDGPVVPSLKTQPPDLTTIAARAGGYFPTDTLRHFVAGGDRLVAAHGSKDMPVWAPIFRTLEPRDPLSGVRIANVVDFIESLQKP
jgi:mono/diheme cytochrome c family protein